jgi:hypothetical protein
MSENTCAVKDCRREIPRERAFCRPHWSQLTEAQRAEVYSSYRSFQRGARSYAKHFQVLDRIAGELTQPGLGV